jgi:pimeloyl-ACP methyl ester carboxylesterase
MPGEIRARVPGGGITGWLAGTGPPVLVLHGGPGLSDYTAPLAAELERPGSVRKSPGTHLRGTERGVTSWGIRSASRV